MLRANRINVTNCALAAINPDKIYITPTVNIKDTNSFFTIF